MATPQTALSVEIEPPRVAFSSKGRLWGHWRITEEKKELGGLSSGNRSTSSASSSSSAANRAPRAKALRSRGSDASAPLPLHRVAPIFACQKCTILHQARTVLSPSLAPRTNSTLAARMVLTVRTDGALGLCGKYNSRPSLRMRPNKWHNVTLTCRLPVTALAHPATTPLVSAGAAPPAPPPKRPSAWCCNQWAKLPFTWTAAAVLHTGEDANLAWLLTTFRLFGATVQPGAAAGAAALVDASTQLQFRHLVWGRSQPAHTRPQRDQWSSATAPAPG